MPALASASSVGVSFNNEPNSTKSSEGVVASITPGGTETLTSVTIDGVTQSGDVVKIYKTNYDGSSAGSVTVSNLPYTFSPNTFRCYINVTTSSTSTGWTAVYFVSVTNNSNNTAYFDPIYQPEEPPPDDGGSEQPPDDGGITPPPPPDLPSPPEIPDAPSFSISQPNLPSWNIITPGPGTFDGTYFYQEPAREGGYTYTPPPLNVPEPVPSPPPPPPGPGLFDFSSIMQTLGTVEGQNQIDQPAMRNNPITQSQAGSIDTPKSVQTPISSNEPVSKESPKLISNTNVQTPRLVNNPKNIEQQLTIDAPSINNSIQMTPKKEITTPLTVQSAQIDPAIVQQPLTMNTPVTPNEPLIPEQVINN